MSYQAISREKIPFEFLKKDEVLAEAGERKVRREKLQKALQHNRLFYSKATIVFDTMEGTRSVDANIWEVTDNNVLLKGGVTIPVCCIRDVIMESRN